PRRHFFADRRVCPARKDGHLPGENQCGNSAPESGAPCHPPVKASAGRVPVGPAPVPCRTTGDARPGQRLGPAFLYACRLRPVNGYWSRDKEESVKPYLTGGGEGVQWRSARGARRRQAKAAGVAPVRSDRRTGVGSGEVLPPQVETGRRKGT